MARTPQLPADAGRMPASLVGLAEGGASPTVGQPNRPSVRVADRPSELSRKTRSNAGKKSQDPIQVHTGQIRVRVPIVCRSRVQSAHDATPGQRTWKASPEPVIKTDSHGICQDGPHQNSPISRTEHLASSTSRGTFSVAAQNTQSGRVRSFTYCPPLCGERLPWQCR